MTTGSVDEEESAADWSDDVADGACDWVDAVCGCEADDCADAVWRPANSARANAGRSQRRDGRPGATAVMERETTILKLNFTFNLPKNTWQSDSRSTFAVTPQCDIDHAAAGLNQVVCGWFHAAVPVSSTKSVV